MYWLKHQFFDCLRLIGLRDRLRCPSCRSVGSWKPHGGWLDVEDKRGVRRWLCKWCGMYIDNEVGMVPAVMSRRYKVWILLCDLEEDDVPMSPTTHWSGGPWRG